MLQIGFTNFRKFEYFPALDLGEITFLVGSNNTGKSSLVKAFILALDNLKRKCKWVDNGLENPLFKFDANKLHDVHIGTFWRALNVNASEKYITFSLRIHNIAFEIVVTCNDNDKDDKFEILSPIARITLTDYSRQATLIFDYANSKMSASIQKDDNLEQIEKPLGSVNLLAFNSDVANRTYALANEWEKENKKENADMLRAIANDAVSCINNNVIEYFHTHAAAQKIVYSYEDKNDYIAAVLHDFDNEQISSRDKNKVHKEIQKWMKDFGIGDDFIMQPLSGSAYSVQIISEKYQKGIELADIGVGFIQLMILFLKLGILIYQYGKSPVKPTVIIEEPEQNLHPALQSKLARLFYEVSKKYDIRFLIETHSEYLIRSTQNIVGNQKYKSQEELDMKNPFRVYYFQEDGLPYDMGYTPTGMFSESFGEGFFDEAGKLFMTILNREEKKR